jgi:hypothetical protein
MGFKTMEAAAGTERERRGGRSLLSVHHAAARSVAVAAFTTASIAAALVVNSPM